MAAAAAILDLKRFNGIIIHNFLSENVFSQSKQVFFTTVFVATAYYRVVKKMSSLIYSVV